MNIYSRRAGVLSRINSLEHLVPRSRGQQRFQRAALPWADRFAQVRSRPFALVWLAEQRSRKPLDQGDIRDERLDLDTDEAFGPLPTTMILDRPSSRSTHGRPPSNSPEK